MKKMISTLLAALMTATLYVPAGAAVSAQEAEKLGTELTPLGADPKPNADGMIPAWTGGLPKKAVQGNRYEDPYAEDRPLFTITAATVEKHKDRLTPGQQELFKKYPGYKMHVYPTRRSAGAPDHVYAAAKQNALKAMLAEAGNGVIHAAFTAPFPIPKSGVEVLWNHSLHYRGENVVRQTDETPVTAGGNFSVVKIIESFYLTFSKGKRTPSSQNIAFYFMQNFLSPARYAGLITMVHEPINQVAEPRRAWLYTQGLRRVRKAPFIAYDSPSPSADGLRTMDQYDMWNGAPDRYEWELLGKKEIFVPYNAYKLYAKLGDHKDIIHAQHPNPDFLRYELHRVWVVDGKLRKDKDNIFGRRTFYIDEDSWHLLVADQYDKRGSIWRVSECHPIVFYDRQLVWAAAEVMMDLPSRRYLFEGHPTYDFNADLNEDMYSPAGLRTVGVR
ncbi:MAG: DUF1329 domain-containing protein [Elusimicrobia bacterium]|nr:DUF1329 domain-containing protein [Elusimicrobiota bacterium]